MKYFHRYSSDLSINAAERHFVNESRNEDVLVESCCYLLLFAVALRCAGAAAACLWVLAVRSVRAPASDLERAA